MTNDIHYCGSLAHFSRRSFGQAALGLSGIAWLTPLAERLARAAQNLKTGFRPDPTLVHPSLGAVVCHQLHDNVEIPRHVSILPDQFPARGGYLGAQYDAFKTYDPIGPIPDVTARVSPERASR